MKSRFGMAILWLLSISRGAFSQEAATPTLRDDIRVSFPESYVELSNRYDSSDVPELLEILNAESEEEIWPRAAGLLGIVGDDAVVDELIELMERPYNDATYISDFQQATRREAMRALGFLVSRTGNAQALEYLIESLDDSIWRRRNLLGVTSYFPSYAEYDRHMSTYAIFGLALSGHPRAGEALRSLQQTPTSEQVQLRRGLDDTLDSWLEVYDLASERGVAGMFEYYENERRIEAERQLRE